MGRPISQETKDKISAAHRARPKMYPSPVCDPLIGCKARVNNHCCVWASCSLCGNERWVRAKRGGIPSAVICRSCTTDETRHKHRLRELGKKHSPERIAANSRARQGKKLSQETKRKIGAASKGRILTQYTRDKVSIAHKKLWSDPKFREESVRRIQAGIPRTPQATTRRSAATSAAMKRRWADHIPIRESRMTIRELKRCDAGEVGDKILAYPSVPMTKLTCEACGIALWVRLEKGKPRNTLCSSCAGKEMRVRHSEIFELAKSKWKESMKGSIHMRPNKAEFVLLGILNSLSPESWAFVGDWSMILAGKNPDFVNTNGKKQIIELFGDYWHKGEDETGRIDLFRRFGYETLVVWERELKDISSLTTKLREFVL